MYHPIPSPDSTESPTRALPSPVNGSSILDACISREYQAEQRLQQPSHSRFANLGRMASWRSLGGSSLGRRSPAVVKSVPAHIHTTAGSPPPRARVTKVSLRNVAIEANVPIGSLVRQVTRSLQNDGSMSPRPSTPAGSARRFLTARSGPVRPLAASFTPRVHISAALDEGGSVTPCLDERHASSLRITLDHPQPSPTILPTVPRVSSTSEIASGSDIDYDLGFFPATRHGSANSNRTEITINIDEAFRSEDDVLLYRDEGSQVLTLLPVTIEPSGQSDAEDTPAKPVKKEVQFATDPVTSIYAYEEAEAVYIVVEYSFPFLCWAALLCFIAAAAALRPATAAVHDTLHLAALTAAAWTAMGELVLSLVFSCVVILYFDVGELDLFSTSTGIAAVAAAGVAHGCYLLAVNLEVSEAPCLCDGKRCPPLFLEGLMPVAILLHIVAVKQKEIYHIECAGFVVGLVAVSLLLVSQKSGMQSWETALPALLAALAMAAEILVTRCMCNRAALHALLFCSRGVSALLVTIVAMAGQSPVSVAPSATFGMFALSSLPYSGALAGIDFVMVLSSLVALRYFHPFVPSSAFVVSLVLSAAAAPFFKTNFASAGMAGYIAVGTAVLSLSGVILSSLFYRQEAIVKLENDDEPKQLKKPKGIKGTPQHVGEGEGDDDDYFSHLHAPQ